MNVNSLPMETISMSGQAMLSQYQSPFSLSPDSLSLGSDTSLSPQTTEGGEESGDFSRLLAQLSRLTQIPADEDAPCGSDGDSDDDDTPIDTAVVFGSMPDPAEPVVHSNHQDSVHYQHSLPANIRLLNSPGSLNPQPETAAPLRILCDTPLEKVDGTLTDMPLIADTKPVSFSGEPSDGEAARITRNLSEKPVRPSHPLTGNSLRELAITDISKEISAAPGPSSCAASSSISGDATIQYGRITPGQPMIAAAASEWPGYFLAGSGHQVRAVADLPSLGTMVVQLSRDDSGVSVNFTTRGDTLQVLSADARTLQQLVTDSLHPTAIQATGHSGQPMDQENIATAEDTINLSFTVHDDGDDARGASAGNQDNFQSSLTQSLPLNKDSSTDIESGGQFLPVHPWGSRAVLVDFRV
ncbi:hypothetical protein [Endozoicomonas sp.]|uniref:hypothetical protein n=1 Tax=Endozoicomonas sp. TaxID=1892382 RepID=UPI00288541EA|nr:hypothetical protein [Endozoicomonas sp.]